MTLLKHRSFTHMVLPSFIAMTSLGESHVAHAGIELEEIVVTAQKRVERLVDVPLSITAVSGDQLAKAGVTSTADLAKVSPGFNYQESQYGTPVFGIRGISFFDFSSASSPAVSVYVDQVPLPLSILTRGAMLDVERAEILKGPQGTLFGQNSTAGAVNYIAAKPTDEFAAGVDATYGRFDRADVSGYVSGPLSDTLGIRVAVKSEQRDDYQRSITRDDEAGQRDFLAGRIILDWEPTDTVRFELNANAWQDDSDTVAQQFSGYYPQFDTGVNPEATAGLLAQPITPRNSRDADWDPGFSLSQDNSFSQVSLRADIELTPDITLTSISSYIDFDSDIPTDNDGSAFTNIRTTNLSDFKIFNQELRVSGAVDAMRWMVGLNYEDAQLDEMLIQNYNATNTVLAPVPGASFNELAMFNNQDVQTEAVFASLEYDVLEQVTLYGSVRYTDQERDFSGCTADTGAGDAAGAFSFLSTALRSQLPGFDGLPTAIQPGECVTLGDDFRPVSIIESDLDEDNISWRAGFSYKPTDDSLVYGNLTKGYKAGSFTPAPFIRSSQVTRVQQESVLAYELGFRTPLFDVAQIYGAVFYYDYRDKQITGFVDVFPFGNLPASVNVPKSSIEGTELGVVVSPLEGLRLSISGTYIESEVEDSFVTATPMGLSEDIKGQQLPNAPEWQWNGDAEYRFPLADNEAYVGVAATYRSDSYALFGKESLFNLPSYTLVDLRAGVEFDGGRWRAEIFGHNITDEFYLVNVSRSIDAVTPIAGMPESYGITVNYRY